jgi:hypothetical protein
MDIYESIKQDKENDRVFEELQNQDMFGTKVFICPPPIPQVAPMNMMIAVGFGMASVQMDGELVYSDIKVEEFNEIHEANNPYWTVQDAENEARKDPDHEWIIDMQGPLQGRTYKRMGEDNWVLMAGLCYAGNMGQMRCLLIDHILRFGRCFAVGVMMTGVVYD